MSLFNVFNTAGSALNAETIRLNTTASNLANAESVNGDSSKVYRARHPVFQTMLDESAASFNGRDAGVGVRAVEDEESAAVIVVGLDSDVAARRQRTGDGGGVGRAVGAGHDHQTAARQHSESAGWHDRHVSR